MLHHPPVELARSLSHCFPCEITALDTRDFVTVAMMSVKNSFVHRPRSGEVVTPNKARREPRKLGPHELSIVSRSEGTTVQLCGDSTVTEQWIHGDYAMGKKYRTQLAESKTYSTLGGGKAPRTLWEGSRSTWNTSSESTIRRLIMWQIWEPTVSRR